MQSPLRLLPLLLLLPRLFSDSAVLWNAFRQSPDDHPRIPNNAYAGYARGERPIPQVPAVVDVRAFGARGDGQTLNDDAVRRAIDAAWEAGGGAVQFPAGEFLFRNLILLHRDGVVLRGAGPGQTVLRFQRPLVEVLGRTGRDVEQWNWTGGLLWIGPGDDFRWQQDGGDSGGWQWTGLNERFGEMRERRLRFTSSWENWRSLGEAGVAARVSGSYPRGARRITVDNAEGLTPGARLLLTWVNPPDNALWLEIAGHEAFRGGDWFDGWLREGVPVWTWPVEIAAVEGREIVLTQPTRVSIRPDYQVSFRKIGELRQGHPPLVQEAGVENLTLRMDNERPAYPYNRGVGWNGLFFNRAWNAWARNVEILHAETAINVSSAKNVTVSGIEVFSPLQSKYISTNRVMSHDILYEDIRVHNTGTVSNGINTEWLSSGNVWSRIDMDQGTFDSHRMMAFDAIRTEIRMRNPADARPGGNREAGPFTGRRVVHWNIDVVGSDRPESERGMWVLDPSQYVLGAQVGIRGAPVFQRESLFGMPPGDKGVLVADTGRMPQPPNLFAAQRALRFAGHTAPEAPPLPEAFRRPPQRPGIPFAFFEVSPEGGRAPLTVTLNAALASGRGEDLTTLRWELGDGTRIEGTDRLLQHTFSQPGTHSITLEIETAAGQTARHSAAVEVGNRPPEPRVSASHAFGTAPLTVTFDAGDSRSAYGKLQRFEWDFGDGNQLIGARTHATHTFNQLGTFTVRLRITDDAGDTADWEHAVRVSREPVPLVQINFQPPSLPAPEGWTAEGREGFGPRAGGLRFGWEPRAGAPRRRNSDHAPHFAYDSFVHTGGAAWSIELPNGEYEVRLAAGDATNFDSLHSILVQDQLVVDGRTRPDSPWLIGHARVQVTDGRLTLRDAPGARNVKLAWITIARVPEDQ